MNYFYHNVKGRWNRMRGQTEAAGLLVLFILAIIVGWVINIVKLCDMTFSPFTGKAFLRCAGVLFAPLGAVMGYFVGN